MKLRPYQHQALDAVVAATERGVRRPLVVMATGLGKTVLFSHLADRWRTRGRVMVLAHRRELVQQAAEKMHAVTGIMPATEMGDERAESWFDRKPPLVVSSIQSHDSRYAGKRRMEKFDPAEFSLVIFDEAHRAVADSWKRVAAHYSANPDAVLLFTTATPQRLDGKGVHEETVFSYGIRDGVRDGWLVPIEHRMATVSLDFSRCKVRAGDFVEADLGRMMDEEKPLLEMAGTIANEVAGGDIDNPQWRKGRPGIVFMPSVAAACDMAEILNRRDYLPGRAGAVWGTQPEDERRRVVDAFRNRQLHVLVNCGVFLEGFDAARIAFVVPRTTLSRTMYEQMIGRGTRPLAGTVDPHETAEDRRASIALSYKPTLRVLDFCGVGERHKLVTALHVMASPEATEEEVDIAAAEARRTGRTRDVNDALDDAAEERRKRQEAAERKERERCARLARRQHVTPGAVVKWRDVDPFGSADEGAVVDKGVPASRYWLKPTKAQVDWATAIGLVFPDNISRGPLSAMIEVEMKRRKNWLAWAPEVRALAAHGIDATEWTHARAVQTLVGLRSHGAAVSG